MKHLLDFSKVDLYYNQVHAVRQVSLHIDEGETVALIGANGAGKSSVLRAITGIERIRSGDISYNNVSIIRDKPCDLVSKGIVMVPEGRRIFPYMSVKDNLLMGAFSRKDKQGVKDDLEKILNKFPILRERYGQQASTMSGGEQQMMVIGRALMSRPKLLLMDEPSLGIAPKLVQDIARSIIAINKEDDVSVILVEQNSQLALKISHRTYVMVTGKIAMKGKSSDLLNDDRIRKIYLGGSLET